MIALLSTAFAYDGDPQWDDPITDRAPREQTVSLSQAAAFGPTTASFTRLQLGLTPYSRDRFGVGLALASQLNGAFVPSEDRSGFGVGSTSADLHVWFAPRSRPRTSHDIVLGIGIPVSSPAFFVRFEDGLAALRFGYAGYYDVTSGLDVSLDLRFGGGQPPRGFIGLFGAGNLTFYASPDKERWVAYAGVDGSVWSIAAVAGARARLGRIEAGAGVVAPLRTVTPLDGEAPLWPVVDVRARW